MLMYNAHCVHQDLINDVVEGIFFTKKTDHPKNQQGPSNGGVNEPV